MSLYSDLNAVLTPYANKIKQNEANIRTALSIEAGSPAVVSSTSAMTDTSQIYVLSTNGQWYYHNGSAWVAGGEYGAVPTDTTLTQSGMPADAKKVGDEIADLKLDLNEISVETKTNLVDQNNILNIQGATLENELYSYKPNKAVTIYGFNTEGFPHRTFKPNTQYTLSFDGKYTSAGSGRSGGTISFKYTDESTSGKAVNTTEISHYTLVSTAGKTIATIFLDVNNDYTTSIKNLMVVEGTTEPENFIPYDTRTAFDETAREKTAEITDRFNDLVIDGNQRNLFSKYSAFKGYLTTSGALTSDQAEHNRTTDFIEVGDNTHVTIATEMKLPSGITHWQAFCFYDENKTLIGSRHVKTGGTDEYTVFTYAIPNGAVYVRASSRVYNDWKIMLQFGDVASAWEYNYSDIEYIKSIAEKKDIRGVVKGIVHRGMDLIAPENTMPAFKLAVLNGFKYIETDIALTSDDVPVLLHDTSINRTARNADGSALSETVYIYDITYEQALAYDFGIFKDSEFAGTKIPTLEEFLVFCRNTGIHPYLELKYDSHYSQTTLLTNVMKAIKKCGMLGKITFISFVHGYLNDLVPNYAPNERIGVLASGLTTAADTITYVLTLKNDKNEVFVDASSATSEAVANLRNNNIPLELWTLNTSAAIIDADPYVSGITSDSLDAGRVLAEQALL